MHMAETLKLEIVTPEKQAYVDEVDSVYCPGVEGELGVLPHHAPLLSTLGTGELRIKKGNEEEYFAISGGFLQVRPDKVVVMAELADLSAEIDLEAAEEARREAEQARALDPERRLQVRAALAHPFFTRVEEAKKAAAGKLKVVLAMSKIVLDVKPWDDATDMKELEKLVRGIKHATFALYRLNNDSTDRIR